MAQNKATPQTGGGPVYTLHKNGVLCVTSTIPGCGHSTQELKQLAAAGYELRKDGKKVRR